MLGGCLRQLRDPLLPRRNAFESCPGKGRGAGSSNGSEMRASYFMQVDQITVAEHVLWHPENSMHHSPLDLEKFQGGREQLGHKASDRNDSRIVCVRIETGGSLGGLDRLDSGSHFTHLFSPIHPTGFRTKIKTQELSARTNTKVLPFWAVSPQPSGYVILAFVPEVTKWNNDTFRRLQSESSILEGVR